MRAKKPAALVTREWLAARIGDSKAAPVVIGRALAAIYRRQTPEEQQQGETSLLNGIGFTGTDAKLGTRCAEHFNRTGTLAEWMVRVWSEPTSTGFPKICKYARQLNDIAVQRFKLQHTA